MISAPLSETYGRRFIYVFVTSIFILGSGFAQNLATPLIYRLLAGIFCSFPLAVGAGTILDIWSSKHSSTAMVLLFLTAFLGLALGSLVGG
ncbi:MFS transporter [Penicillium alfredii]|uniref:MFS transporter n=1 Tax=Penicillium alfredii TaxID=1506179 RepID=A0A9W9ELR9_9EURO|nr:MFS transporter [Penicillium alfredii]KAJ5084111.1 MFS transporter [Penicillium alfredii]